MNRSRAFRGELSGQRLDRPCRSRRPIRSYEDSDKEDSASTSDEEPAFLPSFVPSSSGCSRADEEDSDPLPVEDVTIDSDDDHSEDDAEWEESPSIYYLNRDEVETTWRSSRPRLMSLLTSSRDSTSQPPDNRRPSNDESFDVIPRNSEQSQDREEDEEEVGINLSEWAVPIGPFRQEDYTWEQRHPTAARVLSAAENLPYVQEAREAGTALTERAQPYVNSALETYNEAAERLGKAARVAGEVAVVTGQVSRWIAGEAWHAVEEYAPVVQAHLPTVEAVRLGARLQLLRGARAAQVHWALVREGLLAVAPLERHMDLVRRQRRR